VWIQVIDDGAGLDRHQLYDRAYSRGLTESRFEDLTDSEILNFMFAPGFSTSDVVSDISGRGVGMDVVRRNIEGVNGRIDVTSKLGVGTTFTLRIPLTLAIIEGELVRVAPSRVMTPSA
jgi:two-component system chemotaxis sensor kinase CheA